MLAIQGKEIVAVRMRGNDLMLLKANDDTIFTKEEAKKAIDQGNSEGFLLAQGGGLADHFVIRTFPRSMKTLKDLRKF